MTFRLSIFTLHYKKIAALFLALKSAFLNFTIFKEPVQSIDIEQSQAC